jgi:hypothetical protein
MTNPSLYLPSTILRKSYERARSSDLAIQIQECADLLCCPELLSSEILDAYAAIESFGESEMVDMCHLESSEDEEACDELVLEHFYETQEVQVAAQPSFAFRCIATDVMPVPELLPSAEGARDGFDYVALRPELGADPILGVAQSSDDTSAYALILRMLACFTELVPQTRLDAVNRSRLKGALDPDPTFELHVVLWDEGSPSAQELTLCEFARDLAEVARSGMQSRPELGRRVGRIRCLRMDPRCFDNRLWQVWEI